jgi:hypothetical protein
MTITTYDVSVPLYSRGLKALATSLAKAETHAKATGMDINALLTSRLYADMWSLIDQVRAACNHAIRGPARLAGVTPPTREEKDTTFAQLQARIEWALAFLEEITPAHIEGGDGREIVIPLGKTEQRMTGKEYLLGFSLPNFYFHAATAYGIMRHNGVPLKKDDFLG